MEILSADEYPDSATETDTDDSDFLYTGTTGEHTDQELDELRSEAEEFVDEVAGTVFNYNADTGDITEELQAMVYSAEGSIDNIGNINTVMSGSNAESEYNGFSTEGMYLLGSGDTFEESATIYGTASVHFKNDMVEEGDYEIYIQMTIIKSEAGWKLYRFYARYFYRPGTVEYIYSSDNHRNIQTKGTSAGFIDFEDPEGYLSDYTYGVEASDLEGDAGTGE